MNMIRIFSVFSLCACPLLAQTVTPHSKGNGLFYFQCANVYLEIDSTAGGRISSLKVDSQELLYINRNYSGGPYWGSTLWLSPQTGDTWRPAEIDVNFYTGGIRSNVIVLSSSTAKSIPISITKKLSADSTDTSLTIKYDIVNRGTSTLSRAAWELTRVLTPGCLTFWPSGDYIGGDLASKVVKNGTYQWYPFSPSDPSSGTKFFADGKEGWLGHVTGNRVLFVKRFTKVPRSEQASGEAEIELWLSGDHQYIELENQSPYRSIPANDTLEYVVKWYLRKLPSAVSVSVGSKSLIDYSRLAARIDSLPPTGTRIFQSSRGPLCPNSLTAGRKYHGASVQLFSLLGVRAGSASARCEALVPGIYITENGDAKHPLKKAPHRVFQWVPLQN